MPYEDINEEVRVYKEILEEGHPSRLRLFLSDRMMHAQRKYWEEDWNENHQYPYVCIAPRGIGLNWLPCFICNKGGDHNAQPDMASFVNNKEDGEKIVEWFTEFHMSIKLDFRPSEPDWVQVKIGACKKHEVNLKLLEAYIRAAGNVLSKPMIEMVK